MTDIINLVLDHIFEMEENSGSKAFLNLNTKNSLFISDILLSSNTELVNHVQLQNQNDFFDVYQPFVHQQHIGNLCGYHASYNLLIALTALKSGNPREFSKITSSAEFWKFHFETTSFLWQYGNHYENQNKWPWTYKDTHFGDFERTYLDVCLSSSQRFKSLFKSNNNFIIKFYNFQYQFGNILNSLDNVHALDEDFTRFRQFNEKDRHLILTFMLGITNHWTSMIAHKFNGKIEILFFDSNNKKYLTWDDHTIEEEVKREAKPTMSEFKKMVWIQTLKDTRDVVAMFSKCLTSNHELMEYHFNQKVSLFIKDAEELLLKPFGIPLLSDFNYFIASNQISQDSIQLTMENLFATSISHFQALLKISRFLNRLESDKIEAFRWIIVFMKDFETPYIKSRRLLDEMLVRVCYMDDDQTKEGKLVKIVLRMK